MSLDEVLYLYFACTAFALILGVVWSFLFSWFRF